MSSLGLSKKDHETIVRLITKSMSSSSSSSELHNSGEDKICEESLPVRKGLLKGHFGRPSGKSVSTIGRPSAKSVSTTSSGGVSSASSSRVASGVTSTTASSSGGLSTATTACSLASIKRKAEDSGAAIASSSESVGLQGQGKRGITACPAKTDTCSPVKKRARAHAVNVNPAEEKFFLKGEKHDSLSCARKAAAVHTRRYINVSRPMFEDVSVVENLNRWTVDILVSLNYM
jgi:hypothetical protein